MEAIDIKKIAVIGAGVIGNSWATNFIWKGYPINLWLYKDDIKETVEQEIQEHLEIMALNGVFKKEEIPQMLRLIDYTSSLEDAVKDVQLIQEAAPENLELKQKMLVEIDRYANPQTIYASSTSSLLISDIARNSQYPQRCIGAHPYNPPHLIPLVEITKPEGEKGSNETTKTAAEFYKLIKKEPIILKKDVSGFIGNQIQNAVTSKCAELLQKGISTVEDIDKAICFGPGLRWAIMEPYLIFQLGGGKGGIKGIMMHIKPNSLKNVDEQKIKEYEFYADFLQSEVIKELKNRSPEFGNENQSLRKFRDQMLIELLKGHNKL